MGSKSILVSVVIGILVGGIVGYQLVPAPDYSPYEDQIAQLHSQASSLSSEIDDIESQLKEAPSLQDYYELQQQVRFLEVSANAKDDQINFLKGEISTLELQVVSLESEISDIEASVEFRYVAVSFSRPEDTSSLLQHWIGRANETIQLMVMLITQDELADALIDAHERGVDIDIVIDDGWYFSSGSDYQDIVDAGIDIRGDERGGLMHHKVMIIDGYIIVTGSYNWSASAEDSNDENILIIKSTIIASEYIDEFERIWSQTTPSSPPPTFQYELSLTISGSGSTNPSAGSHTYDEGTNVQITATAESGWDFDYWKLDDINVGSQNPYSVSMKTYHTLVAVFVEEPQSPLITQYELTISISGSGTTNPSQGSHTYDESTNVQVTAIPASGWDFDHWLLDGVNVGGANPYSVAMNEDHILSAIFQEEPPLVGQVVINEVEANPPGNDNYGDVLEWVELYNPSSVVVDISGWKVSTTHGTTVTLIIPGGTTLSPGGYYIVQRGQQWIDNEDEKLVLKDSANNVKDTSRTINDTDNDNNSWQRNPDGASNWSYKTSTKGSAN